MLVASRRDAWRSQTKSGMSRGQAPVQCGSLFLVGLDQDPVGIARTDCPAEGPKVAGLDRIAQRSGDHFAVLVAGDRGDIRLEAYGDYGHVAVGLRRRDQHLLNVDQAVIEDEPVLLPLLDGRVEGLEDMV